MQIFPIEKVTMGLNEDEDYLRISESDNFSRVIRLCLFPFWPQLLGLFGHYA